jgi:translation initiation factor eIF-2B subunit gamma
LLTTYCVFLANVAEAKEEKFMSSSGLEATEQELDAFADDGRIDSEGGDDEVEAA